jgi:arsenite methyltransferase
VTEQVHAELPQALQRAVDLLAEPPADPDVSKGYLDLLKESIESPPKNTGAIQAVWASGIGSMLYDNAQVIARKVLGIWQAPIERLSIPSGIP